MGKHMVPSGYVKIAFEHGPFRVSFPNENDDFRELCQGTSMNWKPPDGEFASGLNQHGAV